MAQPPLITRSRHLDVFLRGAFLTSAFPPGTFLPAGAACRGTIRDTVRILRRRSWYLACRGAMNVVQR